MIASSGRTNTQLPSGRLTQSQGSHIVPYTFQSLSESYKINGNVCAGPLSIQGLHARTLIPSVCSIKEHRPNTFSANPQRAFPSGSFVSLDVFPFLNQSEKSSSIGVLDVLRYNCRQVGSRSICKGAESESLCPPCAPSFS